MEYYENAYGMNVYKDIHLHTILPNWTKTPIRKAIISDRCTKHNEYPHNLAVLSINYHRIRRSMYKTVVYANYG